jgi:toxin ParE1/3/4
MAKLPIVFLIEARLEADAAFEYYRERSVKAAESFYLELERAQAAIQDVPGSWAPYLRGTRRYLLRRFPYVIVYRATDNRIEIIAVAHGYRKPGYWSDRLKS